MVRTIVALAVAGALASGEPAHGQNDWQYPDPYFGVFEIEKSRSQPPSARPSGAASAGPPAAMRSRPRQGFFRGVPATTGSRWPVPRGRPSAEARR